MSDIPAVKRFVESYKKLGQNSLSVETWYQRGRNALKSLRAQTTASTDVPSLSKATKGWLEFSVFLKGLLLNDQDAHIPGFVEQACTTWWDSVTERQIQLGCSVADAYRGMAAYVIAQLYFRRRDWGAALRWASLGYLADKLGKGQVGGGNEVTLRFGLAVPKETLALLDSKAKRGRNRGGVEGLPEWLLAEALNDARGLSLVAPSGRYSHHPCCPFVKAALDYALSGNGTSNAKGKRLEVLVAFLASTVPGMRPRLRVMARGRAAEHDVVATLSGETQYPLPEGAPEWLIECKNWRDRVKAEKVGHFLAKMQHSGARFGIIIAKAGLTRASGETGHAYADRLRTEVAMREAIVCLVVDAPELRELGLGGTFRGLIDKKYEESRFGR